MNQSQTSPTYTGTQTNYYFVCHRKLWLFSHNLTMEHTSDTVYMGKLIGEETYSRGKKEILVDNVIKIDFVGRDRVIHEVKKSNKVEQAHEYQLLYYLYHLKKRGLDDVRGELNYPKLKQKKSVELSSEREKELVEIFGKMDSIINLEKPPSRLNVSFCRKCSYYELCWIE
jgi:CRISPR-associated exonuclease Cas4